MSKLPVLACSLAPTLAGEAEGDELRRNWDYGEVLRRGYFAPEGSPAAAADAEGISQVWGDSLL